MKKITAIIPTLNEEIHIANAIKSVSFANEIIVIDSYSTDKTVEIAEKFNVKIIKRKFDDFSSQKNFAINQAAHDWIFLLDADETVDSSLRKEITEKLTKPHNFVGFYIYRIFYFNDKILNHSGWKRDKVMRLFDRRFCSYQGKVHEKIHFEGKVDFFENKLNHYSYKNEEQYKQKLKGYAKLQALELKEADKLVTPYHIYLKPFIRFLIHFVVKLGFLDGVSGFKISRLHAYGVYRRYIELLKLRYSNKINTIANPLESYNLKKDNKSDVSIIIVNYKSWNDLDRCLTSISSFDSEKLSLEVLVVDNYSDDGILPKFVEKFKNITFIQNSGNNGFANGCNVGANNANGEHLLFLNPDTIANLDAIEKMLSVSDKSENYGIISCHQEKPDGKFENILRFFPDTLTLYGGLRAIYRLVNKGAIKSSNQGNNKVIYPDWVSGSVVLISQKWFDKIRGWNEDYWMYYEDVDLCKKVSNNNGKVALVTDAKIIHNHGGSSRINISTALITKIEVLISKHVYIQTHFSGFKRVFIHVLLVISNVVTKFIRAFFGIFLSFMPKMKLDVFLFIKLVSYYFYAIRKRNWRSPRALTIGS